MTKLRVAFIGTGDITDLHYPAYHDNPKAALTAICDVDEARLHQRAAEWEWKRPTPTTTNCSPILMWMRWKSSRPTTCIVKTVLDSPAVAIWKYKGAEKYGSYEAVTSDDMLVQTQYGRPEDEWVELTGSRGFIWVTRCTANLLDRPPVIMYRDGVTTEFSNMDAAMGASFEIGVNDFFDGILSGRQPQLTAEEGKAVFQFCRAIQLSAKEGREVRPEEIN
jgi:predicted dehydrogenase